MSQLFSSLSSVILTPVSTKNGNKSVLLVITSNFTKATTTTTYTATAPVTTLKFLVASTSTFRSELAILTTARPVLNFLSNFFPFQLLVAFLVALNTPASSKLNLAKLTPSRTATVFVWSASLKLLIRAQATSVVLLFPFLCLSSRQSPLLKPA